MWWHWTVLITCWYPYYGSAAFWKCCDEGWGLVMKNDSSICEPRPPNSPPCALPPVYSSPDVLAPSEPPPDLLYGKPPCPLGYFHLTNESDGPLYLMENGKLLVMGYEILVDSSSFCLECFDGEVDFLACLNSYEHKESEDEKTQMAIYPVGMVISLPFLLATFLVYAVIPDLRNFYGRTVMSHVSALFSAYLFLVIVQLGTKSLPIDICILLAYMIQFFFLAVFFWLNVMCFDIYWAFSGIRNLRGSVKEREHKKFILYTLYAWGGPLVLLSITLIMDYSTALPENSPYRPNMGKRSCFFLSDEGTWLYFYGPMAVLIFCNLLMFSITARRLFVHRRETSVLKSRDSKRHDNNDKERFHLYLKLFVVMGINWVMELVSWVLKGPQQIWYVTDITNTLQGVFIFIIFVCKPRILRLINQRLCPGKKLWPGQSTKSTQGNSSQATGSTTTSSVGSKKQAVSTINMKPVSEDSVRLNAEDSDGQI